MALDFKKLISGERGDPPGRSFFSRLAGNVDVTPGANDALVAGSDAGSGLRRGFAGGANLVLGASSLIRGLRLRRPSPYRPTRYIANIRPAQGFDEATRRAKNEIVEQAASATRDVNRMAGSDVGASIAARLGIQKTASQALADTDFKNAEAFRQDQNRVSQEQNREALVNAQLQDQANQINFASDQAEYQANRNAVAQGLQSALQFEANREADLRTKAAQEAAANQNLDVVNKALEYDLYTKALSLSGDPEVARRAVEQNPNYGYLPTLKTSIYTGNPRRRLFGRRRIQ